MKALHRQLMLVVGLVAFTAAPAYAETAPSAATDPGFVPDTGQINPGFDRKNPMSEGRKVPTPAEARAAKMMQVPTEPSAGSEPASGAGTTGSASSITASASLVSQGPIGSTGQTIPAKFSERNDVLDRVPIMAMPLPMSDQDRQRIYQAVMADKSQPAASADALEPASVLTAEQALNEIHALPDGVKNIATVKQLQYLKARDKVLLVDPITRIVVEQITS